MAESDRSNTATFDKCKRCQKPVQSGITCINYSTVSYKSCLQMLRTGKFISDVPVNCCTDYCEEPNIEQAVASSGVRSPIILADHSMERNRGRSLNVISDSTYDELNAFSVQMLTG